MIENQSLLAITGGAKANPLTVITGLKYNANLIKIFNNMTFLYDVNWEYEKGNPTYPLAFFYVKSCTEIMVSEISKKPLLFYNGGNTSSGVKSGAINIIADNIITQPKQYKLDIIIPSNEHTSKNASFGLAQMADIWAFIASGLDKNSKGVSLDTSAKIASTMRIVNISASILESLLKGLYGLSINASNIVNMILQQQDYNKNSIEYMWRNRRIIKLKMWNGWKFKHVAIQSFEVTKKGENGDFYEASLTCQELPIMTLRNQGLSGLGFMSYISAQLGNAQKTVASAFVKAMSASAGE